jgi:hypothetical protein
MWEAKLTSAGKRSGNHTTWGLVHRNSCGYAKVCQPSQGFIVVQILTVRRGDTDLVSISPCWALRELVAVSGSETAQWCTLWQHLVRHIPFVGEMRHPK